MGHKSRIKVLKISLKFKTYHSVLNSFFKSECTCNWNYYSLFKLVTVPENRTICRDLNPSCVNMTEVRIPDRGGATMKAVDVGGYITPIFWKSASEIKHIFDNVPSFKFRDDDIMLLTFAKTGTNWMYEILSMILNRSSESVKSNKVQTMMEAQTVDFLDQVPSPRVMNDHYPPRYLPMEGLREKQIKTILCLRNPKDTAVSYYNHMKGIKLYEYTGKWEDWIPTYIEGQYEYGKYTDYLKELDTVIKQGVGFPLHIMYYEDLKMNGMEELDKLLKFLEVDLDETLKKDIMHMCGFERMKNKDKGDLAHIFNDGFNFFRKVGNWKSWFTVAQNEQFDQIWESEMKGYDMFKFKYTM